MASLALSLLPWLLPTVAVVLVLMWRSLQVSRYVQRQHTSVNNEKAVSSDPYADIEPLLEFDWSTTTPIKIRPFKPRYHLTMALETCPLPELVAIDDTYLERMALRRSVLDDHPKETYLCNDPCTEAVFEVYAWMFGTYLPQRYPTMYTLVDQYEGTVDSKQQRRSLYNIPANKYIPLEAPSAMEALYILGCHVDTDILILLPSSTAADGSPIYHLEAFVCCFPSGFKTQEKLGLPLADIHKPVPGYKAKIEKSMDRFFAKMELGKAVRRANWAITTDISLYSQGGTHMYEDGKTEETGENEGEVTGRKVVENRKTLNVDAPDVEESIEQQKKNVRIEDCRLRCERQTLHRLTKTKALAFMFKTYQYKLEDVKAEGSGPELADAIAGLALGSVPDMAFYKRQVVWGDKVVEYLRS